MANARRTTTRTTRQLGRDSDRAAALTKYPAEGKKDAEVLLCDFAEQYRIGVANVSEARDRPQGVS